MRHIPFLVVPTEPAWQFTIKRFVQYRGQWITGLVQNKDGTVKPWPMVRWSRRPSLVSPFDTEPMECPYGEGTTFVRCKDSGKKIPVRLQKVECDTKGFNRHSWVLSFEKIL